MKKSETTPVKKLHLRREVIRTGIRAGRFISADVDRSMNPGGGSGIVIILPPEGAGAENPKG